MDGESGLTLVLTARIPTAGIPAFQAYEAQVLPLLAGYGGQLERRLRNADGTIEVHIVRFETAVGLDNYRSDPRRAEAGHLLAASGATIELTEMTNVD